VYTLPGHELRFLLGRKTQFLTADII
jgi:hypothetical protein